MTEALDALRAIVAEGSGDTAPTVEHPGTRLRDCGERLARLIVNPGTVEEVARVLWTALPNDEPWGSDLDGAADCMTEATAVLSFLAERAQQP